MPEGLRNYFLAELQEPYAPRSNRTHFYQYSPLSGRLRIRLKEAQKAACRMIKNGGRALTVEGRGRRDFHVGRIYRRQGEAAMFGEIGEADPVRLCIAAETARAGGRRRAALRGNFLRRGNIFR